MKLHIKNMVCIRCKMVVKSELENLGLHHIVIELGEVEILEDLTKEQYQQLNAALSKTGLELVDDSKTILVEKIVTLIIDLIHYNEEQIKVNLSEYLSDKLKHNYTYLSNLFSEVKGTTIERYYLNHKIERVKELLVYEDLSLTEIAYKLHYSSVAHLSNQFRKLTGLTPSNFKNLRIKSSQTLS